MMMNPMLAGFQGMFEDGDNPFFNYDFADFDRQMEMGAMEGTLQKLIQELKHHNPEKQKEYHSLMERIYNRPHGQKQVFCVKDSFGKELVIKGHFKDREFEKKIVKIIKILKNAKEIEAYKNYIQNVINIRQITEVVVGEEGDQRLLGFITIEQDSGYDFSQYLQKLQRPLEIDEIQSYIYQMTRGLGLLTELGTFHGDVKASNFIILNHKKPLGMRVIKVVDFTASKVQATNKTTITTTSVVSENSATLRYFSLERGRRQIDDSPVEYKLKMDAWSLGILLTQMCLAGRKIGEKSALAEFLEHTPKNQGEFQKAFFRRFLEKADALMAKLVPEIQEFFHIFELRFRLLALDEKNRIDILSALRFLKLNADRKLRTPNKMAKFMEQELELCEERRSGRRKVILQQEDEIQYITSQSSLDSTILVDQLQSEKPVYPYTYPYVMTVLPFWKNKIITYDIEKREIVKNAEFDRDLRQAQSLFLFLGKGELGVIGGFERGQVNQFSLKHIYIHPESHNVDQKADIPQGRAYASAMTYSQDFVILIGGMNEATPEKKTQTLIYSWQFNQWKCGPFLNHQRMQAGVCRCGDYIYVVGGQWSSFNLEDIQGYYKFDLPIERWKLSSQKVKDFELFKVQLPSNTNYSQYFWRKYPTLMPLSSDDFAVFGGFRTQEDSMRTVIIIHTNSGKMSKYLDKSEGMLLYFQDFCVPYHDGRFYLSRHYSFEKQEVQFLSYEFPELTESEMKVKSLCSIQEVEPKRDIEDEELLLAD